MIYRTIVVHPVRRNARGGSHRKSQDRAPSSDPQEKLEEAINLAQAVGGDVLHAELIPLQEDNPRTLLGKGTVERLRDLIIHHRATLVVINASLTGTQQRNLEKAWGKALEEAQASSLSPSQDHDQPSPANPRCEVVDRTGLILAIFAERAQTREGRLQVALADLLYQRSRLVRSWTHLERQRGAMGAVGGPGEKQIELDRRLLDDRIKRLKLDLAKVQRTRHLQRQSRQKVPYPVVALVGYTNAGKSTLFNHLTQAHVLVKDQVFATLDPTMRHLKLPDAQRIILSDTVGFISDIPTHLVAAFRATLEEVLEADLLLHVVDRSSPSYQHQMEDVEEVLKSLGVPASKPRLTVYTKMDKLMNQAPEPSPGDNAAARAQPSGGACPLPTDVYISATEGTGITSLKEAIAHILRRDHDRFSTTLPLHAAKEIAWLRAHGHVMTQQVDDSRIHLQGTISSKAAGQFQATFSRHLQLYHDTDVDGFSCPT